MEEQREGEVGPDQSKELVWLAERRAPLKGHWFNGYAPDGCAPVGLKEQPAAPPTTSTTPPTPRKPPELQDV